MLVLWGWQAELLPWGLAMGVALEGARLAKLRFDIAQGDFNRLWNFTTLLFLGTGLYLFLLRQGPGTVGALVTAGSPAGRLEEVRQLSQIALSFLRWLPFVLFPFMLAHAWSQAETLPWSTFSLYQQGRARRRPELTAPAWTTRRVHPGGLYLALVLFASSAAITHPQGYLPALLGVLVLALWPWRSRRFRAPSWAALFLLVAGLSVVVQQGLSAAREAWQALENRLLQGAAGGGFDQLRSFTALGAVGRLKQSGRVILRIRTTAGRPPGLLREAAFTRFRASAWTSGHRDFQAVAPGGEGTVWRLAAGRRDGRSVTVGRYTADGEAPLALPPDTLSLHELPALAVETNFLAAARVRGAPPLIQYRVEQGTNAGFDGPPEAEDTNLDHLAPADADAIRETAARLGLARLDPVAAVAAVERHFATGFEYSLWQGKLPAGTNTSPLAVFLPPDPGRPLRVLRHGDGAAAPSRWRADPLRRGIQPRTARR